MLDDNVGVVRELIEELSTQRMSHHTDSFDGL
jgi:hypothetical protein